MADKYAKLNQNLLECKRNGNRNCKEIGFALVPCDKNSNDGKLCPLLFPGKSGYVNLESTGNEVHGHTHPLTCTDPNQECGFCPPSPDDIVSFLMMYVEDNRQKVHLVVSHCGVYKMTIVRHVSKIPSHLLDNVKTKFNQLVSTVKFQQQKGKFSDEYFNQEWLRFLNHHPFVGRHVRIELQDSLKPYTN